MILKKDEVAKRNCDILGYYLYKNFYWIFTLNRQFQNMFL